MRLISFTISNYRSFFEEQTISFDKESKNVDAILGPNGSGKSNLFDAIRLFRDFIRTSTKYEGKSMQYQPFLFNTTASELPTSFQAEMQTDKHVLRYFFSFIDGKIDNETLARRDISASSFDTIFTRKSLVSGRFKNNGFDGQLLKSTREDALVLTKAWENNNKYAIEVFEWLDHLMLLRGDQPSGQTAQRVIEDKDFKSKLLTLLKRADLYIQDVAATKVNMPDELFDKLPFTSSFKKTMDRTGYNVQTTHMVRDADGNIVDTKQISLEVESDGTRRIFEMASTIIDALSSGDILYIDEFETHLHPKECKFLVDLFMGPDNTSGAQLVINTHNTQVMDQVGRNNVHLFGKNNREETIMGGVPKDIRTDDPALEKKYNKGMFGAVPNIGN